jgi:hypothetical protein
MAAIQAPCQFLKFRDFVEVSVGYGVARSLAGGRLGCPIPWRTRAACPIIVQCTKTGSAMKIQARG